MGGEIHQGELTRGGIDWGELTKEGNLIGVNWPWGIL